MSMMVERNQRWAVVGDDAGYLSPSPSGPGGAGVLAVLGLLCIAVAVWAVGAGSSAAIPAEQAPASLASAANVPTFETHELAALHAGSSSYAPRQSSGWHRHPGLHLATVVSGVLTVCGEDCTAATFGPGQEYVGGDEPHLARNETEETLEMAVTYLPWPGHTLQGFRIDEPPPAFCPWPDRRPWA